MDKKNIHILLRSGQLILSFNLIATRIVNECLFLNQKSAFECILSADCFVELIKRKFLLFFLFKDMDKGTLFFHQPKKKLPTKNFDC